MFPTAPINCTYVVDGCFRGLLFVVFPVCLFQPSSFLLGLSRMTDFPYPRCHRCSVTDNHVHCYRFYYTVILLPTQHTSFPLWCCGPTRSMAFSFLRFLLVDHTKGRTTVGRTPLDELSARPPENTHCSQQGSRPPSGWKPTTLASERPQTYALDDAATWAGEHTYYYR
jgi:hypothetical protein